MADWIKMRNNLWDDPRVSAICDATDAGEAAVVGALYWLWASADQHSTDGFMPGLTLRQIDRKTGVPGFGEAIAHVGWIEVVDGGIQIIRFDDHNGASAKTRALTARRVAKHKAITHKAETGNAASVTQSLPVRNLEREREEEQKQEQKAKTGAGAPTPEALFPEVDPDHLRDWVKARKVKRLPLTATAAKGFRRDAEKLGMTVPDAVKLCAERGWAGLYDPNSRSPPARGSPQTGAPPQPSRTFAALATLQAMKSDDTDLAPQRNPDRPAAAGLALAGPATGAGRAAGHG